MTQLLQDIVKEEADKYRTISAIGQTFDERPNDPHVRESLGNYVHSITPQVSPDFAIREPNNHVISEKIEQYHKIAEDGLYGVVKNNFDRVLRFLKIDKLINLIFSTKPHKIGRAKHDKYADMHQKYMSMAHGANEAKEKQKQREYLELDDFKEYLNSIKNEYAKKSEAYRIIANPTSVLADFENYAKLLANNFVSKLKKETRGFVRKYITRNYDGSGDNEKKKVGIEAGLLVA